MGLSIIVSMGYGTHQIGKESFCDLNKIYAGLKRVGYKKHEFLDFLSRNRDEFLHFISKEGFEQRNLHFFDHEINNCKTFNLPNSILYGEQDEGGLYFVNFAPFSKANVFIRKNDPIDSYDRPYENDVSIKYLNNSGIYPYTSSYLKLMKADLKEYFKTIPGLSKIEGLFKYHGEDIRIHDNDYRLLADTDSYLWKAINNDACSDVDLKLVQRFIKEKFRPPIPIEILSVFFLFVKEFGLNQDAAHSCIDMLRPCIITNLE